MSVSSNKWRRKQPRSIDIFHPLARVDWEECGTIPASPTNVQCVYLNGKLHVGGHYLTDLFESSAQLFISSPDLSSWTQVDTPTGFYGLTTFHNRIVLVGGMKAPIDMDNEVFTDELWLSDDGSKWEQTIQPMSTPRFTPLVLNPGNPECIVVVGGGKGVEVFIDGQWSSVDPLPISCNDLFATLHNRNWFIRARALEYSNFVYCSVDSLVSAASGGSNRTSSTPGQQPLWKRLPVVLPDTLAPTSFYGELAIVEKFLCEEGKIYAFNPVSRALVHVADTPVPVGGAYNTPRLLLMEESYLHPGSLSADTELKVYKPVVSVSSVDYDGPITISTLSKLEEKRFPIVSALDRVYEELATAVGVTLKDDFKPRMDRIASATHPSVKGLYMQEVISQWLQEQAPTLRNLFETLKKLNLEDLGREIEQYLSSSSGIKSLKEMSTSVVMSALLQQRSLEPDQVAAKLPDYISPRDKAFISNRLETLVYPTVIV